MLERSDVAPVWHRFINHPFVLAMGNGTLPVESFKGYLVQDYLYLVSAPPSRSAWRTRSSFDTQQIQFARANALAGYKAKNMRDISAVSQILNLWARQPLQH